MTDAMHIARQPWTEAEGRRVEDLWRQGYTQAQIAADVRRTHGSVAGYLGKLGLHGPRSRNGLPKFSGSLWRADDLGDLSRLLGQGKTVEEIAATLSRTPGAVASRIHEMSKAVRKEVLAAPLPQPIRRELPLVPPSRTCTWLDGDPKERNFCGADSVPGLSYCPDHRAIVFVPWAPREVKVSF